MKQSNCGLTMVVALILVAVTGACGANPPTRTVSDTTTTAESTTVATVPGNGTTATTAGATSSTSTGGTKPTTTVAVTTTSTRPPSHACGAAPGGSGAGGKRTQVINFAEIGTIYYPVTKANLTACATSGLPVQYSTDAPNECTLDTAARVVAVTGRGCTVTASQPGNADFEAAAPVSRTVNEGNQQVEVVWASPLANPYQPGPITVRVQYRSASPITATVSMMASPYDVCSSDNSPALDNAKNPTVTFRITLKEPAGGSATCTLQANVGAQFIGAEGDPRTYQIQR